MICTLRSARSLNRANARFRWSSSIADADLVERVDERVAAGVLAQHERVALEPDLDRVHDLVGGAVAQHAVLVDAALVRERARAHDRLVRLHGVAGRHRDQARRAHDLLDVQVVLLAERLAARAHDHRDLLERAVAGALADAVHRDLDLAGAVLDAGERVRDREPEVVVAVRRDHDVVGRLVAHDADQLAELGRRRVADRVGHVDRRRPALDREPVALEQELERACASRPARRTPRRRCSSSRATRSRGSRRAPAGGSSSASTRAARRSWR